MGPPVPAFLDLGSLEWGQPNCDYVHGKRETNDSKGIRVGINEVYLHNEGRRT